MNGICIEIYRNIGKRVQDACYIILSADSHNLCCQSSVFCRWQIFFTENDSCGTAGCNPFNPCQEIFFTQHSIRNTHNIKHTHNRSEPAAALHRTYPHTWF